MWGDGGTGSPPAAYQKAAEVLRDLNIDIKEIYKEKGIEGIRALPRIGVSTANQIEEYIVKKKIKSYEELQKKTALREIVTHFFETKGVSLEKLKANAKKRKIIYARYAAPAEQLLELADTPEKAKEAISTVAAWARSRGLDYTIETVSKRWLELDQLKPKKAQKKAFYKGDPMTWVESKKQWFVVTPDNEWLEYAGTKEEIEWKLVN